MSASTIRHDFYQTNDLVILSIYQKGLEAKDVGVKFSEKELTIHFPEPLEPFTLSPLSHGIIANESTYRLVGKIKIEVSMKKLMQGLKWEKLVGEEAEDALLNAMSAVKETKSDHSYPSSAKRGKKDWGRVVREEEELLNEPLSDSKEDPNAGSEQQLNELFQKIYADGDDETKKAMIKSMQESGGTTLSTNWNEIGKKKTEVKPPSGAEARKW